MNEVKEFYNNFDTRPLTDFLDRNAHYKKTAYWEAGLFNLGISATSRDIKGQRLLPLKAVSIPVEGRKMNGSIFKRLINGLK